MLLLFLFYNIVLLVLLVISCSPKKKLNDSTKTPSTVKPTPTNSSEFSEKKSSAPSTETQSGGGESGEIGPIFLDERSDLVTYILTYDGHTDAKYFETVQLLEEKVFQYNWSMKKRLAADDNGWRELVKKAGVLAAEGFNIRAGSEEAKQARKTAEPIEQRMLALMMKKTNTTDRD